MKSLHIIVGWSLSLAWLWCLLWFPSSLSDAHGFHQMHWVLGISAIQPVAGLVMLAAARRGKVSWLFACSVALAPPVHWLGSSSASPVCFFLLIGPALLTLFLGICEFVRQIHGANKVQFAT